MSVVQSQIIYPGISPPKLIWNNSLTASSVSSSQIDHLLTTTQHTLYRTKTVFPFDLFPDELAIDETKVNIISHEFFYSEHVCSILIKDISEVDITASIFFATLTILHQGFKTDPFVVQYLWRSNAIRARRIIQGLILCERNKISIDNTDKTSLAKKVEELGKTLE